jgi:hypothetical protein
MQAYDAAPIRSAGAIPLELKSLRLTPRKRACDCPFFAPVSITTPLGRRPSTPTALRPPAQGRRVRAATLGLRPREIHFPTPTGNAVKDFYSIVSGVYTN